MTDPRIDRMARLLTGYSVGVHPGDRVIIEAEVAAEPLVRSLVEHVLKAGGHPHLLVSFEGLDMMSGIDATFMTYANQEQLEQPAPFMDLAYETFEGRIRIHSASNTKLLAAMPAERIRKRRGALKSVLATQFDRGQRGELRWVTTLFPTQAYAQQADMSLEGYEKFVYQANHVQEEDDPVVYWQGVKKEQQKAIDVIQGSNQVEVRGPNCELKLSVKDRVFLNASGDHNMPDGEIYTGPVEDSADGWVRFTYPAVYQGQVVSGIRLGFKEGRVVEATADKGQELLTTILDTDAGSRYLGEFAIGTNFGIDRFTGNILFDEKIGGSFHMAVGAGYPETGNHNQSAIHWDMICDLQQDSEILVDGSLFYKDGAFQF
jgi:aminopeptidase